MELGTTPIRWEEAGRVHVAYEGTRLTFRRDAWDLLPDGGLLIQLVHSLDGMAWVAMTRDDLVRAFPNVLASRSWNEKGRYNYSSFPPKAREFIRELEDLPECCRAWNQPRPARVRTSTMDTEELGVRAVAGSVWRLGAECR